MATGDYYVKDYKAGVFHGIESDSPVFDVREGEHFRIEGHIDGPRLWQFGPIIDPLGSDLTRVDPLSPGSPSPVIYPATIEIADDNTGSGKYRMESMSVARNDDDDDDDAEEDRNDIPGSLDEDDLVSLDLSEILANRPESDGTVYLDYSYTGEDEEYSSGSSIIRLWGDALKTTPIGDWDFYKGWELPEGLASVWVEGIEYGKDMLQVWWEAEEVEGPEGYERLSPYEGHRIAIGNVLVNVAEPFELDLRVAAFIPLSKKDDVEWLNGIIPLDPAVTEVSWAHEPVPIDVNNPTWFFTTDNREFPGDPGTSRIAVNGVVETSELGQMEGDSVFNPGLSTSYHVLVHQIATRNIADANTVGSESQTPAITEAISDLGGYASSVTITAAAGYPFAPLGSAPNIDFSVKFEIRQLDDFSVLVTISGTHDAFPAYEVMVEGIEVHSYLAPGQTGPGIINLNTELNIPLRRVLVRSSGSGG